MTALWSTEPGHLPSRPVLVGWPEEAACRDEDPDLFFSPEEERGRCAAFRETLAKRMCASCPASAPTTPSPPTEPYGVWGGLTAEERTLPGAAQRPGRQ